MCPVLDVGTSEAQRPDPALGLGLQTVPSPPQWDSGEGQALGTQAGLGPPRSEHLLTGSGLPSP